MVELKQNVELKNYTNTKTGGVVENMYYPTTLEELIHVVNDITESGRKFEVLGDMTNVAIASGQLNFDVINMSKYGVEDPVMENDKVLRVGAGYKMKDLTRWAYRNRIAGLAWMEGIPGTIGAGIFMNAGFLIGQDIQTFLIDVAILNLDTMKVETLKNTELKFRYRYSRIQDINAVILGGRFLVTKIDDTLKGNLRQFKQKLLIDKYHKRRERNQPLELPSAGTVFVPPTPWHVGGMLREMNMLGFSIGGAQISEKSPGFIVGKNNMTGENYRDLVFEIRNKIKEQYDLNLEPEVRLLGFDNDTKIGNEKA
ncbi:UDP-N-acetylmuramate dehydrogenase [Weissella sp. GP1]|uniref:UDP-N-acetylmuramate dehydrogenase n=1 Tax=Weissella confusa TaxID=1583 RepID=UPI0032DB84B4